MFTSSTVDFVVEELPKPNTRASTPPVFFLVTFSATNPALGVITLSAVENYFDVKRKKYNYKTVIECVKESNILIGLKKTCLGVLDRGDRDKDSETNLKERGGIEMSTTVLHSRCSLLRLNTYLRFIFGNRHELRILLQFTSRFVYFYF